MVCNNKWDSVLLATLVSLMLCCVIIHKYGTPNFNGNKILELSAKITQDDFFRLHDQYILMYNRIPKTGSTSMLHMLTALRENNMINGPIGIYSKFNSQWALRQSLQRHMNMSQQMMYAKSLAHEKVKSFPKPIICQNHVHYIDFSKLGVLEQQPIYFNTVRDPYDRFKSKYYHIRGLMGEEGWVFKFGSKWFTNYHPDSDPSGRDYWEWKNKTFEDCVMDFNDKECHISNGSIRDYAIPYFCGQDLECTRHNSQWALRQAIENVEEHYPVVGVLEEMDSTLSVMQAVLPRFFRGIHDKFGGEHVHKNKQSYSKHSPSQEEEEYIQEVENIIKNQLKTEYEFYNYIKQRLQGQAKTLPVMLRERIDSFIL